MEISKPLRRTLILTGFAAICLAAAFLLGQRSVTQKDAAYFFVKETKVKVVHEVNQLSERLESRPKIADPYASDEIKVFTGNDFSLQLLHLEGFGNSEKTAGYVPDAQGVITKYEQNDLDTHWTHFGLGEAIQDAKPSTYRGGGLKQIWVYQDQTFGLISLQQTLNGCYFASVVNLSLRKEVFRAPCLPPVDELDFSSIGGAWTAVPGGIIMSLGTPSDDERVANLAQDPASPYGKVLFFDDARLKAQSAVRREAFQVHSSGHRNPQGMVRVGNAIYAIDHGPKGGDEINLLESGRNYGWPLFSLGSTYQGQPHRAVGDPQVYTGPLFAFVPSIAPSDITSCPALLMQRYAPLNCVLITSLRGQSLFVGLIGQDHRVVSLERINVDMRLREFLRLPGDRLAVATDGFGAFEVVFGDLIIPH
ncbi:hypothetical protein E5678_08705 [Hydrogenophaga sp. PAMC20947]|nr:hypothetical protein E5678_08705 [Hydrogenophaga sp. PAMC20947]